MNHDEKRKKLLIKIKDQEKLGINDTGDLIDTLETVLKESIVRTTKDKSISSEKRIEEINSLHLLLDLVPVLKKNL